MTGFLTTRLKWYVGLPLNISLAVFCGSTHCRTRVVFHLNVQSSELIIPTFFFFIQFNVPFEIISLIETSQSIGGAKREYPGKTT